MVSIARAVFPVWRSPITSSRWPRPIGTRLSTIFRPVCTGSCTLLRGMMPGAFTSTRRRSAMSVSGPLPSIGLPRGSTTRPNRPLPTGASTISLRRRTSSPSLIALSSPKMTMPTLSRSRFRAMPLTPALGNSTSSPDCTLSRPYTRAMPSPTDSTWPMSETSASSPKLAICDFRMAEISAARMSMEVSYALFRLLGAFQGEFQRVEPRLQRGVVKARADPHLQPAEDGGIDLGFDFGVLAKRGAQRGGERLGLGGGQRQGGGDFGRDRAAVVGGQLLERGDHRRDGAGAAIRRHQAEELAGGWRELGRVGDRGQGAALGLGVDHRRADHRAQVGAVGAHRLQRLQVGLDRARVALALGQFEEGLGVSRAHVR